MKYNPKVAEQVAAMPGFARLHPAQPADQVQGMLELLWQLEQALAMLTGMARGDAAARRRRVRRADRPADHPGLARGQRRARASG